MKIIKNDYKPIIILLLAVIVSSLVILFVLKYLLPLFFGIIIAIVIEPLINFLSKRVKLTRGISSSIVLTAVFIVFLYGSTMLVTRLTFELGKLINMLPNYDIIIDRLSDYFVYLSEKVPDDIIIFLETNINQILSYMTGFLSNFYSFLMSKLSMIPNLLGNVLIFVIFTFLFGYFLSREKEKIIASLKNILPDSLQNKLKAVQLELLVSFFRLIKAQILLVTISTVITITGFYILRVNYALTLGLLCGLFDILPVFGPSIIFIPWIIFCLVTGDIGMAISLLVLYIIILGSRQLLQAKVIGQNLGIDPFLTLLSIYLGIQFFGFLGLFLGPLVVVVVRALLQSGLIPPLYNTKS